MRKDELASTTPRNAVKRKLRARADQKSLGPTKAKTLQSKLERLPRALKPSLSKYKSAYVPPFKGVNSETNRRLTRDDSVLALEERYKHSERVRQMGGIFDAQPGGVMDEVRALASSKLAKEGILYPKASEVFDFKSSAAYKKGEVTVRQLTSSVALIDPLKSKFLVQTLENAEAVLNSRNVQRGRSAAHKRMISKVMVQDPFYVTPEQRRRGAGTVHYTGGAKDLLQCVAHKSFKDKIDSTYGPNAEAMNREAYASRMKVKCRIRR